MALLIHYWCVVSYSISTSNHNSSLVSNGLMLVVSYSISTSNHNTRSGFLKIFALYLIPFLHQTTTVPLLFWRRRMLYLIPFLHQTTTFGHHPNSSRMLYLIPFLHQTTTGKQPDSTGGGCILFHFYIKPQPGC